MNFIQLKEKLDAYNTGNLPEGDTARFLVYLYNENLLDSFDPRFRREFEIYHERNQIFIDEENNSASVNEAIFPAPVVPPRITLNNVEKAFVFQVGSFDLDEFLSAVFSTDFEFEAAEELGDGSIKTFDVEATQMDDDDVQEITTGKFDWLFKTGDMLNHACFLGLIEPGEYVIRNRC